jgi:predicted nucleic acid-binding protein
VVIDLDVIAPDDLPDEVSVSAVTLAELSAGPHATDDPAERARRQDRLQQLESWVEPIPFDADCARAYGRIYAAVLAAVKQAGYQGSGYAKLKTTFAEAKAALSKS